MTVGIVIPLKAKRVSRSWDATVQALKNTIGSIINQSDQDYKVVVVGHDRPDLFDDLDPKKIVFQQAKFPAPDRCSPVFTDQDLIDDKVLKIITGLFYLRGEDLSFIYQLDSDDLIHKDFVRYVKSVDGCDAIIICGGYLYFKSSGRLIETNELDQYCGSVVVAKAGSFPMPSCIQLEEKHNIPWTKYRHMNIHKYFEVDTDQKIKRTNERLVAYLLASGDNLSDRWRDSWIKRIKWKLRPYLIGKKKNAGFDNDFGLAGF